MGTTLTNVFQERSFTTLSKSELESRLILLTKAFMDKASYLKKADQKMTQEQEIIRNNRAQKLTHDLYKKF